MPPWFTLVVQGIIYSGNNTNYLEIKKDLISKFHAPCSTFKLPEVLVLCIVENDKKGGLGI